MADLAQPVTVEPWVGQLLRLLGEHYGWSRTLLIVERHDVEKPASVGWAVPPGEAPPSLLVSPGGARLLDLAGDALTPGRLVDLIQAMLAQPQDAGAAGASTAASWPSR